MANDVFKPIGQMYQTLLGNYSEFQVNQEHVTSI